MNQFTRADRPPYTNEEIHYPGRCSHQDCLDDIIPDPNGVDQHCFKHYDYQDL